MSWDFFQRCIKHTNYKLASHQKRKNIDLKLVTGLPLTHSAARKNEELTPCHFCRKVAIFAFSPNLPERPFWEQTEVTTILRAIRDSNDDEKKKINEFRFSQK